MSKTTTRSGYRVVWVIGGRTVVQECGGFEAALAVVQRLAHPSYAVEVRPAIQRRDRGRGWVEVA